MVCMGEWKVEFEVEDVTRRSQLPPPCGPSAGGVHLKYPRRTGMGGLVPDFSGARVPGMALMDFGPCPTKRSGADGPVVALRKAWSQSCLTPSIKTELQLLTRCTRARCGNPELADRTIKFLVPFLTTFWCEQGFSRTGLVHISFNNLFWPMIALIQRHGDKDRRALYTVLIGRTWRDRGGISRKTWKEREASRAVGRCPNTVQNAGQQRASVLFDDLAKRVYGDGQLIFIPPDSRSIGVLVSTFFCHKPTIKDAPPPSRADTSQDECPTPETAHSPPGRPLGIASGALAPSARSREYLKQTFTKSEEINNCFKDKKKEHSTPSLSIKTHSCLSGEWKTVLENCLSTPDLDLNLYLPVIDNLVYCESRVLDHEDTEAGSEPAFAWRDSEKPLRKNHPSLPDRDLSHNLTILGSPAQHETSLLANYPTKADPVLHRKNLEALEVEPRISGSVDKNCGH
uniref:Uncharacterized protein n=1 Tax=Timema genevievae TaxID=629358 RepID=A0A7R9PJ26_TIMGE|nr:unnamed protein product [Timema genevievae]